MANGKNQKPKQASSQPNPAKPHVEEEVVSLRTMREKFSHVGAGIAIGLAVVVGLGMVAYFGGGGFGGSGGGNGGQNDVVAKVNGIEITQTQLAKAVEQAQAQMRSNMYPGSDDALYQVQQNYQAFNQLKQAALLEDAAKREGVRVNDDELLAEAKTQLTAQLQMQRMQISQKKPMSDKEWADFVKKQTGKSLPEFIDSIAKDSVTKDGEQIKLGLLQKRLQDKVSKVDDPSDEVIKAGLDTLTIRHILVNTEKRSDAEALKLANEIEAKIKAGGDFAKLAGQYSDDPGSKLRGGELGPSTRSSLATMYVPEFAEAAGKLKLGEVSGPVKSSFGYHIIKLDKITSGVPKDFEKRKAELKKQYIDTAKQALWSKYQKQLIDNAKVEINDPEIKVFDAAFGDPKTSPYSPAGISKAVKLFEEASKTTNSTNVQLQLAQLYSMQSSTPGVTPALVEELKQKAAKTYKQALVKMESPMVRIELAKLLWDTGDTKGTIEQLKMASKVANNRNLQAQDMILAEYKKIGRADLVAAQTKLIADYKKPVAAPVMQTRPEQAKPEPSKTEKPKTEKPAPKPSR
ncbi:MAG: peptidylprolyl isomerase [Armatimonadota bacterium]